MKFGDLLNRDICNKLSMISFDSPQKNLKIYQFVSALKPLQDFVETERFKILEKYGEYNYKGYFNITGEENVRSYKNEWSAVLDLDTEEKIPSLDLTENDFLDDNCHYPEDKKLWINANDMNTIFDFIHKVNQECQTSEAGAEPPPDRIEKPHPPMNRGD